MKTPAKDAPAGGNFIALLQQKNGGVSLAELDEALEIHVVDEPGPGGANHLYNLSFATSQPVPPPTQSIAFQKGPIAEAGINGISNEALLAVVIDRMRGFQYGRNADGQFNPNCPGKYACPENARALAHLESALDALQSRTRARVARGVEGTHQV